MSLQLKIRVGDFKKLKYKIKILSSNGALETLDLSDCVLELIDGTLWLINGDDDAGYKYINLTNAKRMEFVK